MIEGKTSKDQRSPPMTIAGDRKAGICSPPREDLITDCSLVYPKAQERSLLHKRHDTKDCRQLRSQIEEAGKSGQLSHLVKGIKKERAKSSENQRLEGKKDVEN
ncbi:hypothetical protein Tco_0094674 [Tanacetum coccineum]